MPPSAADGTRERVVGATYADEPATVASLASTLALVSTSARLPGQLCSGKNESREEHINWHDGRHVGGGGRPLASQPRVFGYCRARVVRPSWRIIARGALGIEVTGEDDGEDLSMEFANIHEGESRRRSCAADVVRVALHGQRTDGDDAIERCLKRLPLPDLQVPKSLLNLASPGSSSPSHALRSSLHPRKLRVPDVEDALVCGCELTPGPRRDGARRMRCRRANEYLAELFLLAGLHLEGPTPAEPSEPLRPLPRAPLDGRDVVRGPRRSGGRVADARDGIPPRGSECGVRAGPGSMPLSKLVRVRPGGDGVEKSSGARPRMRMGRVLRARYLGGEGARREGLCVVPELHTTFEGDFGEVAGDVLYLHAPLDRRAREKVFAFPR